MSHVVGNFEMLNAKSDFAFVFSEVSDANFVIFALRFVFSVHVALRPNILDEWDRTSASHVGVTAVRRPAIMIESFRDFP
jgi:hypothetical protein